MQRSLRSRGDALAVLALALILPSVAFGELEAQFCCRRGWCAGAGPAWQSCFNSREASAPIARLPSLLHCHAPMPGLGGGLQPYDTARAMVIIHLLSLPPPPH